METKEIICPNCGGILKTIEGVKVITCKHCNTDFDVEKAEEKKEPRKVKKEKVFYDKFDVVITNTQIKLPGKIYPIGNITSVSKKLVPSQMGFFVFLILVGIAALISSIIGMAMKNYACAGGLVFGAIMIIVGIIVIRARKHSYYVAFQTASGEIKALTSQDEEKIDEIVEAISKAIEYRG